MLFTSWAYAAFLPAIALAHRYAVGARRTWLLLGASYFFYGVWDVRFLGLIWLSTVIDYVSALQIQRSPDSARRRWLTLSLVTNLGILGVFKYWNFFTGSAADLLQRVGLQAHPATLRILLPVGISFYTFQTLSYTIDVYRGRIEPERRFDLFALYVAFFPQLVAGPIERAERLIPQLRDVDRRPQRHQIESGLWLIGRGLFRKLAIADGVAQYVDSAFAAPLDQTRLALLVGVVAFSLQIYGDFAGYTDIARGSAKLFGVDLMQNFRQPYAAKSVTEFWRRWHISLSDWLKDYLYIPLGGNRVSQNITYRNLMITMLLGGLWHGASWTFVIWGGLHGSYLLVERLLPHPLRPRDRTSNVWAFATAGLVMSTWIPFRADTLVAAGGYLRGLLVGGGTVDPTPAALTVVALAAWLTSVVDRLDARYADVNPLRSGPAVPEGVGYAIAAVSIVILSGTATVPFLYFQF